jgi:hypothetical protein
MFWKDGKGLIPLVWARQERGDRNGTDKEKEGAVRWGPEKRGRWYGQQRAYELGIHALDRK